MRRDAISLSDVPAEQQETHEALLEWARWCAVRPGSHVAPMFRGYTPYLYPEATGGRRPVDQLLALKVQRAYTAVPERHRMALAWWYCFPYVGDGRVRREMGVTRMELARLVIDGRTMVKNLMR